MAKVLQIENYAVSSTIDLLSPTGIAVFQEEIGVRPLTSGGLVTRTMRLKVMGSTKAAARTNASAFITALRKAVIWNEDDLQAESWFLKEGADGESVVRSLIMSYEASTGVENTAVDGYQSMNEEIYIDLALTLQNHREEVGAGSLFIYDTPAAATPGAIGNMYFLHTGGENPTSPCRMNMSWGADNTGGGIRKFWAGIMPALGTGFQPIWEIANGTPSTDTTVGSPAADVYSANAVGCTFATVTAMTDRMTLRVDDNYATAVLAQEAKGTYFVLCRCRVNGTGSILLRVGQSGGDVVGTSYNETRLLVSDGEFHHVPVGVLKFPARSYRIGDFLADLVAGINVKIAAQRLTGTATLTLDALVFIPYDHFISVDTLLYSTTSVMDIRTHENMDTVATLRTAAGAFTGYAKINEIRNWMYPPTFQGVSGRTVMVVAGEHTVEQIHDSDLDWGGIFINNAYEAYNV